jgi:transglutaminase-like putative cysteine protease
MSAWLALVITDMIAVSTFARCFTGPGELSAALTSLVLAHAVGLFARRGVPGVHDLVGRRPAGDDGSADATAGQGRSLGLRDRTRGSRGWWALGVVVAVFLPIGIVLGPGFFSMAPAHAWYTVSKDMRGAWAAFSFRVAPVPELPGLVLATGWASGATGLLAELTSSMRRAPAALALAPALGVYLFASALGTGSWRVPGLALMAGCACWYLVASVRERERTQEVLVARPDAPLSIGRRAASYDAGAVIVRMVVIAALAAAVIGPNLPGARSVALVTWHGGAGAGNGTGTTIVPDVDHPRGIEVTTLVQVAEEEVDDPSVVLFTVHSSTPTREMVAALDEFNGDEWSATASGSATALETFSPPLNLDEQRPPPVRQVGVGHEQLVQVFEVQELGGRVIPSWGDPVATADAGRSSTDGPGGAVVSDVSLRRGSVYAVASIVADPSAAQLEAVSAVSSNHQDLQLPEPVPPRLVRLANSLVSGATTSYQKARDLVEYLTSQRFRYQLATRANTGTVARSAGYGDLMNFLFKSRTGYCQQFATAFAVLARIDGLPTRIAVGFLHGTPVGRDAWQVEGNDTHAWPQVQFENYGWIDFEPTPGTTVEGSSGPAPGTTTTTTATSETSTTVASAHKVGPPPSSGSTRPKPGHDDPGHRSVVLWALLILALSMFAWAGGVRSWRRLRLRRSTRESVAGILAAWAEALRTLDLAGIRRHRAETYLELATRVTSTGVLSGEAELAFRDLAELVTTASYGVVPRGDFGARQAMTDAGMVVRSARRSVAWWQRVAAALDPRGFRA